MTFDELKAKHDKYKKDNPYAILEELAPPDVPMYDFVEHLFDLWLKSNE